MKKLTAIPVFLSLRYSGSSFEEFPFNWSNLKSSRRGRQGKVPVSSENPKFFIVKKDNCCGQRGGDYISFPTVGGMWEKGITICAWAKFTEPRFFERIVDLGGVSGEEGGYPVIVDKRRRKP